MSESNKMSKSERTELGVLIRKREKLMKAMAIERSAGLLAEFEEQCSAMYSFDQDDIWETAFEKAKEVVADAQAIVAERCKELQIPAEFAPAIDIHWYQRGQNSVKARRSELRQAAKAKIAKMEKAAIAQIERMSLEAQTEVISNGLESDAARGFLARLPDMATMMPAIDVHTFKQLQEQTT